MNDLRQAAQQALEAMENTSPLGSSMESYDKFFAAIDALRAALAQQAEPVEPRWEGDDNITSPWNACMHKNYCVALKEERERRLAQQAGAVEPPGQLAALEAMLRAEVDRLIAAGIPPQRKPLTEEEAAKACGASGNLGPLMQIVRAVERAHKIGEGA